MKGWKLYPKSAWLVWVALCVAVSFKAVFLLVVPLLAVPKNHYLSPLLSAERSRKYRQWLKTVPYDGSKPLPHGSLLPAWIDLLVVAGPLVVLAIAYDHATALLWVFITVALTLAMYAAVSLRTLFQAKKTTGFYVIAALLMLSFSLPLQIVTGFTKTEPISPLTAVSFRIFGRLAKLIGALSDSLRQMDISIVLIVVAGTVGVVMAGTAALLSALALRRILNEYPWDFLTDGTENEVSPPDLGSALYMDKRVLQTGEPYCLMNPDARWKTATWQHIIGTVALTLIVFQGIDTFHGAAFFHFALSFVIVFQRFIAYYYTKQNNTWRYWMTDIRAGNAWKNPMTGIVTLLAGCIALGFFYRYFPHGSLTTIVGGAGTVALVLAAFKLPPSRREWELTGRCQFDMDYVPEQYNKPGAGSVKIVRKGVS